MRLWAYHLAPTARRLGRRVERCWGWLSKYKTLEEKMRSGPCMCGDTQCPSCGPAQGNSKCPVCGAWADDGCECTEEQISAALEADRLAAGEQEDFEDESWREQVIEIELERENE